jgi:hypothetical protein
MSRHDPPLPGDPQGALAVKIQRLEQQLSQQQQARTGGVVSWGFLDGVAAITNGTGDFTASHPALGEYLVTWKTSRPSLYCVVLTANNGANVVIPRTISINNASFLARFDKVGGGAIDTNFCFAVYATS